MIKHLFIFIAFLSITDTITAQNNYVTLHEDCNYSGKRSMLEAGTYKNYQMKINNDNLSCLQIPAGMKVTIYEHDNFLGKSKTFTTNIPCLDEEWNDMASSIVVENSSNQPGFTQNDYITFYNDCDFKGYSRSLKIGTYTASSLGALLKNISSFSIIGNLKLRVYLNNDNASGYNYFFEKSEDCLSSTYNDKISSLVIEYNYNIPAQTNNTNNSNISYATVYADCNYKGNNLSLKPGNYQGDKLGLLKYNISSIELPSNLSAKVYINNEYLSGNYYTVSENISCLSNNANNKIGSLIIEEINQPNYNYQQNQSTVIIYSDGNYKGQAVSLLPGTYASMSQINFPDNALSSLTVPNGYRVVLYEFENFRGKKYSITDSKSGFSFSGWNDKTSSIAVYRDR